MAVPDRSQVVTPGRGDEVFAPIPSAGDCKADFPTANSIAEAGLA